MLAELRDRASVIIDTTNMRPLELGTALERELNMGSTGFMLRVMSFGYKRGVPFERISSWTCDFHQTPITTKS